MSLPISCVLIAFNEAERLPKTLQALDWCDDILVIDSNSTDATAAVVEKYGGRVIQNDFEGFGQQKQFGIEQAKHEWILSLDADEVLSPAFIQELKELFQKDLPKDEAWFIRRRLVFLGKTFKYGKESRDWQLRLFNRNSARWSEDRVHEFVRFKGRTGRLQSPVDHYSYTSLDNYLGKLNRYTSLAAANPKNKRKGIAAIALRYHFSFFKRYILEFNFLNGYEGWLWSGLSATYTLVKYAKKREQ